MTQEIVRALVDGVWVTEVASQGSGGSQPAQASYSGNAVEIAYGDSGAPTWDSLDDGDDLLDRTDPANPLVVADGWYTFTVGIVTTAPFTAGGYAIASPPSPTGAEYSVNGVVFGSHGGGAYGLVSVSAFFAAGTNVTVGVVNDDGAVARSFKIEPAIVVKFA